MRKPLLAIDGLRAIAVLGVVMYHFVGAQAIANGHAPPMWANVGARGVDLFFVISGFCLAYPYVGPIGTRSPQPRYATFLLRRFVRIAPPYYIALTAFALLALTPFGFPTRVDMAPHAFAPLVEYFLDLAFMPPPDPVFNNVFWSLGVEMRWYLLCPLLIALYNRSRFAFGTTIATLYLAQAIFQFDLTDVGTLPAFMLGTIAADILSREVHERALSWSPAIAILFVAAAIGGQVDSPAVDHGSLLWHLAGFWLVVATANSVFARLASLRPIVFIGLASYSIYLIHAPILRYLGQHGVLYPIAAMLSVGSGVVFWILIERPLLRSSRRAAISGRLRTLNATFIDNPLLTIKAPSSLRNP